MSDSQTRMTLDLTVKQIFMAGVAAGVLASAALGFLLTLKGGGSFADMFGGSARIGAAPTDPSAALDAGDTGEAVGTVAPITDADHIRGDKNAKITLLEYSDFQCPFCSRFHPTMVQILDAYKGKVRWVYRHFPLSSIHPDAQKAAEASECAAEQGKFWEMADKMFEKQALGVGMAQLPGYAKEAGVKDAKKFETCLTSGKYASKVAEQLASGETAGVTGTPGTIVLGPDGEKQLVPGALPFEAVKQIVESML